MLHISIFILPFEIYQLSELLIQLKKGSIYLPDQHNILVEVCMNTSLTDWDKSILKQGYFRDKLCNLDCLTQSWAETKFYTSEEINGCNDLRRNVIAETDKKFIMYLDADNVFSDTLLYNMYNACQAVKDLSGYSVIVPEVTKMWDDSWNCIVNREYLNETASHENYKARDPYKATVIRDNCSLKEIEGFKFAGWGTTIQTTLARLINIPLSLSSYGLDDTFLSNGCQLLKNKAYNVRQFVLENEVIIENNKFRFNPYKSVIESIDRRECYLKHAHSNFAIELNKLNERI